MCVPSVRAWPSFGRNGSSTATGRGASCRAKTTPCHLSRGSASPSPAYRQVRPYSGFFVLVLVLVFVVVFVVVVLVVVVVVLVLVLVLVLMMFMYFVLPCKIRVFPPCTGAAA